MTPLVGVIGRKRSGKDSFAAPLVEDGWARISLADPLRDAALALDPLVGEVYLTDPETGSAHVHREARLSDVISVLGWEAAKDRVPEVRRTLQRLGTEAIRALDEGFWTRIALARIAASEAPVVVPDVRYPNEADAVRERGGLIVRVVRPETEVEDAHPSETALDDYVADVVIQNVLGLEDLHSVARAIVAGRFRNAR